MLGIPVAFEAAVAPYKLYLYGVLAAGLIGAGGYATYKWMKADNVKLEFERDTANANATNAAKYALRLSENLTAEQAQSEARAKRAARAEGSNEQLRVDLANAKDAVGKDGKPTEGAIWLRSNVPVSVRELRRHDAGCPLNLQLPCPNIEPHSDTGTGDAGRERKRISNGGWTSTPSPAILQFRQGGAFAMDQSGSIKRVEQVEVVKAATLPSLPKEPK